MIRNTKSPSQAARDFSELATLYQGELFVNLACYLDDSGTHDPTGKEKGAREAVVAGLIGPVRDMRKLCHRWQFVLNDYGASYFHYCEWSDAVMVARGKREPKSSYAKNPYKGWSHRKLDSFLIALAKIVGTTNSITVGMNVATDEFHKDKLAGKADGDPYIKCVEHFYDSLISTIETYNEPWKEKPVAIFCDQGDPGFSKAVISIHHKAKLKYPSIRSITISDKKMELPLQAADIVTYRLRQIGSSSRASDKSKKTAAVTFPTKE